MFIGDNDPPEIAILGCNLKASFIPLLWIENDNEYTVFKAKLLVIV